MKISVPEASLRLVDVFFFLSSRLSLSSFSLFNGCHEKYIQNFSSHHTTHISKPRGSDVREMGDLFGSSTFSIFGMAARAWEEFMKSQKYMTRRTHFVMCCVCLRLGTSDEREMKMENHFLTFFMCSPHSPLLRDSEDCEVFSFLWAPPALSRASPSTIVNNGW